MLSYLRRHYCEFLFRIRLYLLGLRFYETAPMMDMKEITSCDFMWGGHIAVRCKFFRLDCNDHVVRRGKVENHNYRSYIVHADVMPGMPDALQAFHGKYFFFNGARNWFHGSDIGISMKIQNLFLDFVLGKISEQ